MGQPPRLLRRRALLAGQSEHRCAGWSGAPCSTKTASEVARKLGTRCVSPASARPGHPKSSQRPTPRQIMEVGGEASERSSRTARQPTPQRAAFARESRPGFPSFISCQTGSRAPGRNSLAHDSPRGSARGFCSVAMICCSARRPKRQLYVQKDHVTGANFLTATDGEPFNPSPNAVLILTLRMGFGHLRIAHAVASWLHGREAYVYDLLATDTPESESLKRYEWIYSKFSKVASASGGPIEWAFDKFLTSGDASAQCVPARPPPARPAPTRRACLPRSLSPLHWAGTSFAMWLSG